MFCEKCGNQMKDGEKFCSKCGASQENFSLKKKNSFIPKQSYEQSAVVTSKNFKPSKKKTPSQSCQKGKKTKIISISILAVILILTISLATICLTGSAFSTYRELKNGNYAQAVSTYKNDVEDNFVQKSFANMILKNYINKIVDEFKNNKIDFDTANQKLNALKDMGIESADKYLDEITAINNGNIAYDNAKKLLENKDYENAIVEYSKVPEESDNYTDAQAKLTELYPQYIQSVYEEAEQLFSDGEYQKALSLINVAMSVIPTDSVDVSNLIEVKTTAENKFLEKVVSTVNNLLANEDYISASRNVESALSVLPDNSALKDLKSKVEKSTPIYLLDVCKPYHTDNSFKEYTNGEILLIGGTKFTNGFSINNCGGNAVFNLNANYSTISFNVGHVDDSSDFEYGGVSVKVYLDGILSNDIKTDCESLAQKVTMDITGVNQVKFVVQYIGDGSSDNYYGFGNVTVK